MAAKQQQVTRYTGIAANNTLYPYCTAHQVMVAHGLKPEAQLSPVIPYKGKDAPDAADFFDEEREEVHHIKFWVELPEIARAVAKLKVGKLADGDNLPTWTFTTGKCVYGAEHAWTFHEFKALVMGSSDNLWRGPLWYLRWYGRKATLCKPLGLAVASLLEDDAQFDLALLKCNNCNVYSTFREGWESDIWYFRYAGKQSIPSKKAFMVKDPAPVSCVQAR
jgi:hypothetical protein